jgi:O-methyltransferase
VLPEADYTPWNLDLSFLQTYEAVKGHTLVDFYRCWELWSLARQTQKLEQGALLEVGVWRGGTGALLAKAGGGPVYLCDTFTGVPKAGKGDGFYRGGEHADTSRETVEALLDSLNLKATILTGIFPDDTGARLQQERFRLVHVDVDVYESARGVVDWVWPRLVRGGVIVFDDYGFQLCPGVTRLVNEYVSQPDRLVVHNLNGHALLTKV